MNNKLLAGICFSFVLGCGGAADQASNEPSGETGITGTGGIVSSGGQTGIVGSGGNGLSQQGSVDGTNNVIRPIVSDVGVSANYGTGTEDGQTGVGGSADGVGGDSQDGPGTTVGGSSDGPGSGGVGGTADNVGGSGNSADNVGGVGGTADNVGGSGNSADNVGGVGGTADNVGGTGNTADNVGGVGGTVDNVGGSGNTEDNVGGSGNTEDALPPTPPIPPPPPAGTIDNVGGTGATEDAVGGGETLDAPPAAPPPPAPPPAPTGITSDNLGGTGNTSDLIPPTAPLPPAPTAPPAATGGSTSTGGAGGTGGTTLDCPVSCPPIIAAGYLGGLSTGGTSGFNTIVLNDATLENVDTQGRVFIGRNFVTPGYTVGSNMPYSTTRYDLVVGGNLTVQASSLWGLTVQNGLIAYGGTLTGSQYINTNLTEPVAGTPPGYVQATPISTSEVNAAMLDWSSELASLPANGSVVGASGFSCPTGVTLCVINASAGNLISNGTITVTASANTTVVINVSGASVTVWDDAMTISGGATKNNVIFNLYQATDVSMSGISFQGSMLAPLADLYFTNGNIEGQLIVKNWYMPAGTTAGEVHDYLFNGCPDLCIP